MAKQKMPASGEIPGINAGMHPKIRTTDLINEK
jgi:hypothetical protein